jgi:hypothetical protein
MILPPTGFLRFQQTKIVVYRKIERYPAFTLPRAAGTRCRAYGVDWLLLLGRYEGPPTAQLSLFLPMDANGGRCY